MKVLNIRFRKTKKCILLLCKMMKITKGDFVIVETIRGDQIGMVISKSEIMQNNESDTGKI